MEVTIEYTNYKDETSVRHIIPVRLYFGSTVYHPEDQWLLQAYDLDKKAERTFAMNGVHAWI